MHHKFYIASDCQYITQLSSFCIYDVNSLKKRAINEARELAGTQQKTYYIYEIIMFFEGDELHFKGMPILMVSPPQETELKGAYECIY